MSTAAAGEVTKIAFVLQELSDFARVGRHDRLRELVDLARWQWFEDFCEASESRHALPSWNDMSAVGKSPPGLHAF